MYLGQKLLGFHMQVLIYPDEVVKNVHERLGTEWDDYSAKDEIYAFNNNTVIVYGKYSGTYKATGKSFIADFVTFISLMRTIRLRSLFKLWTVQLLMRY